MISMTLVSIACFHKRRKAKIGKAGNNNKNSVGFHRYKQIGNSDDDEDGNLTIKIDSNGMSNGNQKSKIGSKIIAATKYVRGANNTENVNFKLLNSLSDEEDDEEDENFSR
jgi:hypothetical protein